MCAHGSRGEQLRSTAAHGKRAGHTGAQHKTGSPEAGAGGMQGSEGCKDPRDAGIRGVGALPSQEEMSMPWQQAAGGWRCCWQHLGIQGKHPCACGSTPPQHSHIVAWATLHRLGPCRTRSEKVCRMRTMDCVRH